jgi:acyl-CoA thioesterase II
MLSADATIPILYYVDVLRAGKTYVTCSVKAVQRGKSIFMAMCSFQKPEANQPQHAIPVPSNVPPPENCPTEEQLLEETISKTTDPKKRAPFELQLTVSHHPSPACEKTLIAPPFTGSKEKSH